MGSTSPLARRAIVRTTTVIKDNEQFASRSELVYQKLRDGIQQGALKPGQRVMEVEVAEWLAVSRTPVRDALRRLESEGMLTHEPRAGLVKGNDSSDLETLMALSRDPDVRDHEHGHSPGANGFSDAGLTHASIAVYRAPGRICKFGSHRARVLTCK